MKFTLKQVYLDSNFYLQSFDIEPAPGHRILIGDDQIVCRDDDLALPGRKRAGGFNGKCEIDAEMIEQLRRVKQALEAGVDPTNIEIDLNIVGLVPVEGQPGTFRFEDGATEPMAEEIAA